MSRNRFHRFRLTAGLALAIVIPFISSTSSAARLAKRYHVRGQNELSGGIGLAADLTSRTPGGFKWFNDYGHHLRGPTWLNLQLNVTLGDSGWGCYRATPDGAWLCPRGHRFDGTALEIGGGVKLKWRVGRAPLQIHAKIGGVLDLIWFDVFYGTAVALRSGAGLRYFFVPTFSVGAEVVASVGPAFYRYGLGAELFGALDVNFGVEWRF